MKNNEYDGKIKQPSMVRLWFKKALKHIAVGAVALGVVAGAVFGFAGCGQQVNPGPEPTPPTPVDPNPPVVNPLPEDPAFKNVDFDEFLTSYKEEGVEFFNEFVKPEITEGKGDVLSETINFNSSDDYSLDRISYAYIHKTGDTARKFDVVNVRLSAPIKFDDILNEDVEQNDVIPVIQNTLSFEFDAKEDVNRSDLKDALYYRIGKMSSKVDANARTFLGNTTTKNSFGNTVYTYNVLSVKDNKINTSSIDLLAQDLDDAQLIEKLNDDNKFKEIIFAAAGSNETKSYTLQGENIFTSEYKAEFQKENPGPVDPSTDKKIESVQDLVTKYPTELNQGLQGAYDHIVEKVLPNEMDGSKFDASKLSETKWNLQEDANGAISKINYYGKYDNRIFFVTSVNLNSPLNIKDLTDKNIVSELQKAINGSTYNYEINFNYDEDAKTNYPGLAEAVFTAEGLNEENATYYISSVQPGLSELGNTKTALILQVSNNGIKQMSIEVRDDVNGLINNVNSGYYKTNDKSSYDFGEYTIDAQANQVAKTSFSLYHEDTGKYNIEDFGDELLF